MPRSFAKGISSAQGIPIYTPYSGTTVALPLTTVTQMDSRGGLAIPASVKPGTVVRATALVSCVGGAALTSTISAHFGTANTSADTTLFTTALTTGTSGAGFIQIVWWVSFLTATTAHAMVQTMLSGTVNSFAGANQDLGSTTTTTIATTSASFLGFYASVNTTGIATVQGVAYEVHAL